MRLIIVFREGGAEGSCGVAATSLRSDSSSLRPVATGSGTGQNNANVQAKRMDDATLRELARTYAREPAQILIRWSLQRG